MSKLPKLAIVGRPNVGKSALFNRICNKKIAIVDEAEGITRDRLYAEAELFGLKFQIIDTGGIDARSRAIFNEEIKRQAEIAIEEADTIVMVVDAHVGITDLDQEIALILLKTKKPLCLAVNKVDNLTDEHLLYKFQSLGIKHKIPVSAAQGWNIAELLEAAFEGYPRDEEQESGPTSIKVAVVGRPNVGKSSLVNYILDENRCIVSPIPGTTRDSVDIEFIHEGDLYTLIDTAGIRRKHAEHEVVDKFAAIRTQRAIERADVCLLMLDSQQGMTTQEKKIANMIEEAGKGCILLFNKWDLVKGFRMEHCLQGVEEDVHFLKHCPKIFMSALSGRNVDKVFPMIKQVHIDSQLRIPTHQLNKFVGASMQKIHPPMIQGKRLRIYYMAQVSIQPPKFVLFINYPNLMTEAYKKYLYNQFRETYGFTGVPIIFHLKGKQGVRDDKEAGHHRDGVLEAHIRAQKEEAEGEEEPAEQKRDKKKQDKTDDNAPDDFDEDEFIRREGW